MFLLKSDFYSVISSDDFTDLINSVNDVWQNELPRAIETVASYLRMRYDVDLIFKSFSLYSATAQYEVGDWITNTNDAKYICILKPPVGTALTNTTYFTNTDPRNSKIVEMVVDVCLYKLFARLNNYDMPVLRKELYDGNDPKQTGGAMGFLKQIARGDVQLDLPLIEERQTDQTGNIVMYGNATESEEKNYSF